MSEQDPRRQRPVEVKWSATIGQISIDGEHWANVEWSYKREAWCIEDAEGACLKHTAHIRGQEASREAAISIGNGALSFMEEREINPLLIAASQLSSWIRKTAL